MSPMSRCAPTRRRSLRDPGLLGSPEELTRLPALSARPWRIAALLWLVCVLAMAAYQWQFWSAGRLNTDVLALLPASEQSPEVARASRLLADGVSRQVVVMLGAPDWTSAQKAALAWRGAMQGASPPLKAGAANAGGADAVLQFYEPWRDRLLTPAQRKELEQSPAGALQQRALALLHQPGMSARLADFASDPLGLWPQWLQARGAQSRARPRDGDLWVRGDGLDWVVLGYEITGAPFAMNGDVVYQPALDAALRAAQREVPQARLLAAGLPLHAEAAAVRASREVNTIGWGSLAAVVLLAWLAFRRLAPLALTALSLAIGVAAGLCATGLVFGQVHLLTLVFGASLVGVAEDYGIHYFAARQGKPWARPRSLMRSLLPGLLLALVTSVLAYLALGLAPFPGMRQMAVFSAAGLLGAFLTAVCWFPLLDRSPPRDSRFAQVVRGSLAHWPRWRASRGSWAALAGVGLLVLAGLWQLRASDDLRSWQGSPVALQQAQVQVGRLLGTPSVAQFYLVRAESAQGVLELEEALKARLDPLVERSALAGYAAVSDWLPSIRRQEADVRLRARIEPQVLAGVNAALGERLVRAAAGTRPLNPEEWLASPAAPAARQLWLGQAGGQFMTVVMLHGLHDAALLPQLQQLAAGLPGVQWVDRAADVSSVLGRYRWAMSALLLAGHVLVFAALWARFRRDAWRAWLPTAVASVAAIAVQGWLGEPFQLSNILALLLLLGMGVDYGIFLLEHDGDGAAWLAVALGAASTWLAFGLLALSSTPALHAFGLTLMIGIALVWAASPCLRRAARGVPA
jgi:predicted exporter